MLPATFHQTAIESTLNGLMYEIAHCPIAEACLRDGTYAHPCQAIAASQGFALDQFQVPEPWSGHIETAPLLFIGSNPSISQLASEAASIESEAYPRWHSPAEVTEFYFTRRFEHFMAGGTMFRSVSAAGAARLACAGPGACIDARFETLGKPVAFCSSVRRRAIELFGRDVDPGCDYVLSEVVHCKSRSEQGVREALATCTERYLARMIAASAARVIGLLGVSARIGFQDVLHGAVPNAATNDGSTGWEYRHPWGPAKLLGRERYVVTLPHPNARGVPKSIEAHYGSDHLSDLRRVLIRAGSWV